MGDVTGKKPKSGLRWGRVLLFVSLAVNLLIVGMVAGAFYRAGKFRSAARANPPLYDLGYGPYGRAFSKEDRQKISQAMAAHAPGLRDNRKVLRARSLDLIEALRREPYEPELVAGIIAEQQEKLSERQNVGRIILLDHIATMDADKRKRYADKLERILRRGGKRN